MARLEELQKIFAGVDDEKRKTIMPLLHDVVFMEKRLEELRDMPHIRVHPKDKSRQETTAAGKQYKETMQAYSNVIKMLLSVLYRDNSGGADELIERLKAFEL